MIPSLIVGCVLLAPDWTPPKCVHMKNGALVSDHKLETLSVSAEHWASAKAVLRSHDYAAISKWISPSRGVLFTQPTYEVEDGKPVRGKDINFTFTGAELNETLESYTWGEGFTAGTGGNLVFRECYHNLWRIEREKPIFPAGWSYKGSGGEARIIFACENGRLIFHRMWSAAPPC